MCVSLEGKLFYTSKENTELKQEVAYLTARLKKTKLSEKLIEEDLSRIEKSATKSIYKLGVGFERCENKGEKVLPSSFLVQTTTKRKKHSKQPKSTTHPISSYQPPSREMKLLFCNTLIFVKK
jgi:hypothetical protein